VREIALAKVGISLALAMSQILLSGSSWGWVSALEPDRNSSSEEIEHIHENNFTAKAERDTPDVRPLYSDARRS
jgi:hypothetical protein